MVCTAPPLGPKAPLECCRHASKVPPHAPVAGPPGVTSMHLTAPPELVGHANPAVHTPLWQMPAAPACASPVRKISLLTGSSIVIAPVWQSAVPVASAKTLLMAQVLVGVLAVFGIATGGPKRHPAFVHVRPVAPSSPLAAAASV